VAVSVKVTVLREFVEHLLFLGFDAELKVLENDFGDDKLGVPVVGVVLFSSVLGKVVDTVIKHDCYSLDVSQEVSSFIL